MTYYVHIVHGVQYILVRLNTTPTITKCTWHTIQDEYKMTRVQWLLYRPFIHELLHELANPSRTLIKLDGPAGVCVFLCVCG